MTDSPFVLEISAISSPKTTIRTSGATVVVTALVKVMALPAGQPDVELSSMTMVGSCTQHKHTHTSMPRTTHHDNQWLSDICRKPASTLSFPWKGNGWPCMQTCAGITQDLRLGISSDTDNHLVFVVTVSAFSPNKQITVAVFCFQVQNIFQQVGAGVSCCESQTSRNIFLANTKSYPSVCPCLSFSWFLCRLLWRPCCRYLWFPWSTVRSDDKCVSVCVS